LDCSSGVGAGAFQVVQASPWYGTLLLREKMALGYAQLTQPECKILDVQPSIGRGIWKHEGHLMTITPALKAMMLCRQPCRPVLGIEALAVHGVPPSFSRARQAECAQFHDSFLKDLAGNSYVANIYAAVLISVLVHWPASAAPAAAAGDDDDAAAAAADAVSALLGL
jgi:hypothetical protein